MIDLAMKLGGIDEMRTSLASAAADVRMTPKAAQLLCEIAEHKAAEAGDIAATMCSAYAAEIPAYARITDPTLMEDVRSVSEWLVRLWLLVMSTGRRPTAGDFAPNVEGARRRVAQGIDLHSLLRAYRVGVRVMWHELMDAPQWRKPCLQAALGQVAELALDYADRLNTEVAAAYVDELARVTRERAHRRTALLDLILAGPGGETVHPPAELQRPHAVVVAQVAQGLPLDRLEAIGAVIETSLGANLWTVRHQSVIAVAPLHVKEGRGGLLQKLPAVASRPEILAIGLGGTARSARDTRQSYAEAVEALRVGPVLATRGCAVYDYQEFAPATVLLAQPEQARRFVEAALEPLGDLVRRPWVLPTLEAYIARQGRTKEAATLLGVHLNTVKYRLNELQENLGQVLSNGDRASSLLLALKLHRLLEAESTQRQHHSSRELRTG